MKMLMLVYGGPNPRRITSLLDRHHAGGYSEFRNVHGAGTTGRREGTRAWPGESSLFLSVVPKDRAVGLNATVSKAASGAAETVPLIAVTNLARTLVKLKERGIWVLGAEAAGESLPTADLQGPIAWVLGAEGAGLRRLTRDKCDRLISIPLHGSVESLNVSVAAGICLYATRAARLPPIAASNAVR